MQILGKQIIGDFVAGKVLSTVQIRAVKYVGDDSVAYWKVSATSNTGTEIATKDKIADFATCNDIAKTMQFEYLGRVRTDLDVKVLG